MIPHQDSLHQAHLTACSLTAQPKSSSFNLAQAGRVLAIVTEFGSLGKHNLKCIQSMKAEIKAVLESYICTTKITLLACL